MNIQETSYLKLADLAILNLKEDIHTLAKGGTSYYKLKLASSYLSSLVYRVLA